jgi:hypothetical protein
MVEENSSKHFLHVVPPELVVGILWNVGNAKGHPSLVPVTARRSYQYSTRNGIAVQGASVLGEVYLAPKHDYDGRDGLTHCWYGENGESLDGFLPDRFFRVQEGYSLRAIPLMEEAECIVQGEKYWKQTLRIPERKRSDTFLELTIAYL